MSNFNFEKNEVKFLIFYLIANLKNLYVFDQNQEEGSLISVVFEVLLVFANKIDNEVGFVERIFLNLSKNLTP
jgi:hypothetical protein